MVFLPPEKGANEGELATSHHVVLDEPPGRLTVRGKYILPVREHQARRLRATLEVLGHMQIQLVAVEVGVEAVAVRVVEADSALRGE